jgi:hypothetical protein
LKGLPSVGRGKKGERKRRKEKEREIEENKRGWG